MAHKQLLFKSAAREKVLKGVTALADSVRVTLGPKSKCVLIEKRWGKPVVCNDGKGNNEARRRNDGEDAILGGTGWPLPDE